MAIKVGKTVKDRLTDRIGLVVARHEYPASVLVDVDFGVDDYAASIDEWRLDPLPCGVVARAIRAVGRRVVDFLQSDASGPVDVKLAILAPYLYGLATGVAVMLLHCRCS